MSKLGKENKAKGPLLTSRFGRPLGLRPSGIKGKSVNVKSGAGFDPARFKTQHKG